MTPVQIVNDETSPLIIKSDVIEAKNNETGSKITQNEGVCIAWKGLGVTADIKKNYILRNTTRNSKKIIHEVNGLVEPRSLVAILGASGSGKSTLMSALANRQSGDLKVSGDIRINGKKLQLKLMKEISGFVYQDELFIPSLTVIEHLHFAARLKLDKNLTTECRKKLIDEIITDVGLTKCAKNFIGSALYGREKITLSGGERKRLSVATELLTNPSLLFCDEPTTGLDSFTSLNLMTEMRRMTKRRATTIICSVHQPSEQLFNLFHQIILLNQGRIAFSGTTEEALLFFQSVGCHYNEKQNTANYLIECLAVVPGRESETSAKASEICAEFEKSQYAKIIHDRIEMETRETRRDQDFHFVKNKCTKRISWIFMLYLLVHREILTTVIRDPATQRVNLIRKVAMATAIGICMMGSFTTTRSGIQSLKGIFMYTIMENWMDSVYMVLYRLPNKMPIFCREYTNNFNTPLLFYLSNFISMIPLLTVNSIVNVTLVYILVGLRNSWAAFCWTVITILLVSFTSFVFGMLLSLSTSNCNMAATIYYPISLIHQNFLGVYINLKSIPWTISWIRYTSLITYAMEIALGLQLRGVGQIEWPANGKTPCFKTGDEVLKSMDFDPNSLTKNLTIICIIFLILLILGYFVLKIKLYFKTK